MSYMIEKDFVSFDIEQEFPPRNIVQTLIQFAEPNKVTVIEVTPGNEEDPDKFFTLTPYKEPYDDENETIDGIRVTFRDTGNGPDGLMLVAHVPWVNGVVHGIAKYYYPDGKLMEKISYINGEKNGTYKKYDENGVKTREFFYCNGKVLRAEIYKG
jgi:hypothetical protein